jgi:hypothetical protein
MMARLFAALVALVPATAISAQAVDFSTARAAPGSWGYQAVPGGSTARFVDSTGTARLVLQCTKATRRVSISRTTTASAPSIFVWTSSASRSLPVRFEPNAMRVTTELAANDPLLDAIAFSRGRVAVTMTGLETLVVPAWPEAARTVEDCRI